MHPQQHEVRPKGPKPLCVCHQEAFCERARAKASKLLGVVPQSKEPVNRIASLGRSKHEGARLAANGPNGSVVQVGCNDGSGNGLLDNPNPNTNDAIKQEGTKGATLKQPSNRPNGRGVVNPLPRHVSLLHGIKMLEQR